MKNTEIILKLILKVGEKDLDKPDMVDGQVGLIRAIVEEEDNELARGVLKIIYNSELELLKEIKKFLN